MKTLKSNFCLVITLLLSIIIFPNLQVLAFQNEPDNFRGITWGADIKDVPDMVLKTDAENRKYYVRKDDKLKIGSAELDSLYYVFTNEKFSSVLIEFRSLSNAKALKEALFEQHGPGYRTKTVTEIYVWTGTTVGIAFEYNHIMDRGEIRYFFLPMLNEERLG